MVSKITVNRVLSYLICIIKLLVLTGPGYGAIALFVDYTENTELIQQRAGYNISLQCGLKGLINVNKTTDIKYFWYFKQCGEGSGGANNCYDTTDSDEWSQLPCGDNICKSEIELKNVTEKYSGLYKCTVMPKISNTLDIQLVRTYQLDIKNSISKVPEFLDAYPLNKTVSTGYQAVFQCRVFSEDYPTIKWFRRISDFKYADYENKHSKVYYNGQAYELLKSAQEKPTGMDVYLSKLILNEVSLEDEGHYACVAISFRGHSIREAYLQVYAPDDEYSEYWADYNEENDVLPTDPRRFWLLFLMPLGLALFPISVWLCYIIHKRCKHNGLKDQTKYSEEHLAPPEQQHMLSI